MAKRFVHRFFQAFNRFSADVLAPALVGLVHGVVPVPVPEPDDFPRNDAVNGV